MHMVKTQVCLPPDELEALHRIARQRRLTVAELVRQAVRRVWLSAPPAGPVGLWDGPFSGSSADRNGAFDDL